MKFLLLTSYKTNEKRLVGFGEHGIISAFGYKGETILFESRGHEHTYVKETPEQIFEMLNELNNKEK